MILLMEIDTKLLDRFGSIMTLVIIGGMVIVVGRFLLSKSVSGAVASIGICGLLLWAVNFPNNFMEVANTVINFVTEIFKA